MKTYIYTLTDPRNNQCRYIGKTLEYRIAKRKLAHSNLKVNKRLNTHLGKWLVELLSLGYFPIFEIIDEIEGNDWQWLEIYWISQFKIWGFKLVNLTNGGEGCNGFKMSEDGKRKISASHKTSPRPTRSKKDLIDCGFIKNGRVKSEASKEKVRLANKGNKPTSYALQRLSEIKSIPVEQFDLEDNFIKEWQSATKAAKFYNVNPENITRCCKGRYKISAKFKWKYKN